MSTPDMFDHTPSSLVGLEVQLPRHCVECGHPFMTVGPGKAMHKAALNCARCGRHAGWMSRNSFDHLTAIVERFGRAAAVDQSSHPETKR
jgi:hypothetical protein